MDLQVCPSCNYKLTPEKEKYCLYCHSKMNKNKLFKGYQPKTLHGKINRLFKDKYIVRRVYCASGRRTEIILTSGTYLHNGSMDLISKCGGYVDFIYNTSGQTVIRLGTIYDRM